MKPSLEMRIENDQRKLGIPSMSELLAFVTTQRSPILGMNVQ